MKKLEQTQVYKLSGARLVPGNRDNPQSFKVRRAKVGGWRDYFDENQIAAIDAVMASRPIAPFGYTIDAPVRRPA